MKILILYSGGLDSLIMERFARVNYPDAEVHCVWYAIGQEYEAKERAVLPDFVEKRSVDWLGGDVKALGKDGSPTGGIYIPGRNLVLATLVACRDLPDLIWLGALLGETVPHGTDKNYEFLEHINETLAYVLSPFRKTPIRVRFPLADAGLNKLMATKWALEHGISPEVLQHSSSCLSGEAGNCGHCIVCFRRWGIFRQLGLPTEQYNVHPLSVQENLDRIKEMQTGDYYDEHRCSEILPALEMLTEEERKLLRAEQG